MLSVAFYQRERVREIEREMSELSKIPIPASIVVSITVFGGHKHIRPAPMNEVRQKASSPKHDCKHRFCGVEMLHQAFPLSFEAADTPLHLNTATSMHGVERINDWFRSRRNFVGSDAPKDVHVLADVAGVSQIILEVVAFVFAVITSVGVKIRVTQNGDIVERSRKSTVNVDE